MAQSVDCASFDPTAVSSSPTLGVEITLPPKKDGQQNEKGSHRWRKVSIELMSRIHKDVLQFSKKTIQYEERQII